MDRKDKPQFAEIMLGIAENFGAELSKVGMDLRFEALKAFTIDQVRDAALALMKTRKFAGMPTVAEFIEKIHGQAPTVEHRATAEANRIIAHLNTHGATTWPDLSDPITHRLMTSRWIYPRWAAQVLESELKWWAKEFVQAYEAEQVVGPVQIPSKVRGLLQTIGGGKDGRVVLQG